MIAAHAASQTLYTKPPYDSTKSFAHASLLGIEPIGGTSAEFTKFLKDEVAMSQ